MKRFLLLGLVFAGVLAACSSNGALNYTAHTNPPTLPGGSPLPATTGSGTLALSTTSSSAFTLPSVGGYSGSATLPAASVAATLTIADETAAAGPPTGTTALQGSLRRAAQAWTSSTTQSSSSTNTPLMYITITTSETVSFGSSPSVTITLPAGAQAGPYYLAAYMDGAWLTISDAGVQSGSSVTFAGNANPFSITEGTPIYLAFYTGNPISVATPTPTPMASSGPANAIVNGDFETGSLAPWTACSYQHLTTGYAAPVSPSPAPAATASQPPTSVGSPSPVLTSDELAPFVSVTPPPPNYNPNYTSDTPSDLGNYAALTGSLSAQINGTTGICQTVTVPAGGMLSFWVYEGGTGYNFYNGDQEAQILDSTGTTILDTLFVELNCYYDSTNFPESPLYATSGCFPSAYGGTSPYTDWQGGFWTERGPYDLSSYAGQSVTLFLGVWTDQTHAGPTSYANFMFVDNVQLIGST